MRGAIIDVKVPTADLSAILLLENLMKLTLTFDSHLRTLSIRLGVGLILLSLILVTLCLSGIIEFDFFNFAGHSGLRTLAGVAVLGCVISAIASADL